jgi:hypothetical protein
MSDVIGGTDGMPELGAELAAKIQSGLITYVYFKDWRARVNAARAERRAAELQAVGMGERIEELVDQAIDRTVGKAEAVRQRQAELARVKDYLPVWSEAAAGQYGEHSQLIGQYCEAMLRDIAPDVMNVYDRHLAAGHSPAASMHAAASALVTTGQTAGSVAGEAGDRGYADAAAGTLVDAGVSTANAAAEVNSSGEVISPPDGRWPAAFTQHTDTRTGGLPATVSDLAQRRARRAVEPTGKGIRT